MDEENLKLRESLKLYPPRFVILFKDTSSAEDCYAVFKFQGATESIEKKILLTEGIVHSGVCRLLYYHNLLKILWVINSSVSSRVAIFS